MIVSAVAPAYVAVAALVFVIALAVGIYNWRWSIYGLLCYIPVSGIAILATYGSTREEHAAALLAKDFLFVIPAYLGFFVAFARVRRKFWFPGAPLVLFGLLALLVVAQAFNPDLTNHLVGLIGIKIWLFYIPLFFLGYHLVRNRKHLYQVLGLMTAGAVVPVVIGLTEVVLMYAGYSGTVYSAYGNAAAPATQNFVVFQLPGGCTLRRVPSTFSFFYQYYLFAAAMVVISYAWWRGSRPAGRQLKIGGAIFLLAMVAGMFAGVRTGFIIIPGLVLAIVLLSRKSVNRISWATAGIGAAVLAVSLGGVGITACGVSKHIAQTVQMEAPDVIGRSVSEAVHRTWLGQGTGSDSGGARYAFKDEILPTDSGQIEEAWYVKTYLELGVFGVVIVGLLLLTILVRAVRIHRRLRDPRLKILSAGIVALIGLILLYNGKAQYFDIDPINVYFWLFTGILFGLPRLEPAAVEEPVSADERVVVHI
jgi:hypothetical protein